MTGCSWDRLEPLLERCLKLTLPARRAFLGEVCGEDTALEVLRLLDVDACDPAFLAPPRPIGDPGAPRPEEAALIGGYRLLRPLGEGGMGVVWLARREAGDAGPVAVKLLHQGCQSGEARRRFLTERGVLARLEHPFIASLLDSGSSHDGRPYLVMELVDGEPIAVWCNARKPSLVARLALFEKVCEAVAYAHSRGVIHGDLKSQNILIDEAGSPKLLDFGLAQAPSDRLFPGSAPPLRSTHRAYSPQYASPEQVRGEPVGYTSDVYSLGVVLYELLTATRPYALRGRSPREIEEIVCRLEPRRPRQIRLDLPVDLDRIVMTALCKDPAARQATAAELAAQTHRATSAIRRGIPGGGEIESR